MLRLASIHGHEAMTRMLLGRIDPHDAKPAEDDVWTPENNAAEKGHEQIVKLLIERGADISGHMPESMIEIATEHGQTAVVSLLLERGTNAILARSALDKAAVKGHVGVVRLLVDSGARIEQTALRNVIGRFISLSANRRENIGALHDIARILLYHGMDRVTAPIDISTMVVPDIDMTDDSGRTLLS